MRTVQGACPGDPKTSVESANRPGWCEFFPSFHKQVTIIPAVSRVPKIVFFSSQLSCSVYQWVHPLVILSV